MPFWLLSKKTTACFKPVPSDCLVASSIREPYLLPRRVLHKDPPPQFSLIFALHSFQSFLSESLFNSFIGLPSLSGGRSIPHCSVYKRADALYRAYAKGSVEITQCSRTACHNTELKLSNTIGYYTCCFQDKGGNGFYLLAYPSPTMLN